VQQSSPVTNQSSFERRSPNTRQLAPFAQRSTIDALRPSPFAMSVTIKIYFSLPSGKQEVSQRTGRESDSERGAHSNSGQRTDSVAVGS